MIDLINMKLEAKYINEKRKAISDIIIKKSNNIKSSAISSMSAEDIKLIFDQYNQIFFGDWFDKEFKGKLKFSISRRMTKSAGKTIYKKNRGIIEQEDMLLEIRIGVDFFSNYNVIDGDKYVCGMKTRNSLEALQFVLEHELCHVIEFIYFKDSNCKKDRFKRIASNLFGHTESYHELPTNLEIAREKLGLNVGDTVSFIYKNEKNRGLLYRVNKRAVVMVKDKKGRFVDNKGVRYAKYYVPLQRLNSDK